MFIVTDLASLREIYYAPFERTIYCVKMLKVIGPQHEISNNVICAGRKGFVDFLFIVTPIVGVCNCSMFCYVCYFMSILVLQSS